MKIQTIAHIGDDETAKEWLQVVRSFDVAHPGECMFQIFIDAPTSTVDEMEQLLNVDPPLPIRKTFKKQ